MRSRTSPICNLFWLLAVSLLALLQSGHAALAHFSEGTVVRTILVAKDGDGLIAYVRVPAPLVFSDLIGRAQVDQVPLASPFLRFERTGDGVRYRLDMAVIMIEQ